MVNASDWYRIHVLRKRCHKQISLLFVKRKVVRRQLVVVRLCWNGGTVQKTFPVIDFVKRVDFVRHYRFRNRITKPNILECKSPSLCRSWGQKILGVCVFIWQADLPLPLMHQSYPFKYFNCKSKTLQVGTDSRD